MRFQQAGNIPAYRCPVLATSSPRNEVQKYEVNRYQAHFGASLCVRFASHEFQKRHPNLRFINLGYLTDNMVARDGVEPPTPAFSEP